MLGHISKESNFPELAMQSVVSEITNAKCNLKDIEINVARREGPSKLFKVS